MQIKRDQFRPDGRLEREEMVHMQREIAAAALVSDAGNEITPVEGMKNRSIVAVDQAFGDETVVSAAVHWADGEVVEVNRVQRPTEIPYIPGLLAFREGASAIEALSGLAVTNPVCFVDGSGLIHQREAGLATHLGVVFDIPTIGVAKNLLCGEPVTSTEGLATGQAVPVLPDGSYQTDIDRTTIVGYATQTRQYGRANRHINPVYVSPGHRCGPTAAVEAVLSTCSAYKLPDPIRAADQMAGEAT